MRHVRSTRYRSRLLTALLAALSFPATASAQALFVDSTNTHLATGPIPENGMDVEAADIDNDGDLDIIIANEFQANVLLINDGTGRFSNGSKGRLPEPFNIHDSEDIGVADFDKDGDLDIIFVSEDDHVHEYYLNDGTGKFTDVSSRLPESIANAIDVADLTGDGYPDAIVGNAGQDFFLVNDGTGKFTDQAAARLPVESNITQDVELVDIDRDGDLDLLVGNEDGNRILMNDGKGVFTDDTEARLPITADMETRKITPGDVDRDGDLDLFYSNVGWNPAKDPRDRLYINDGAGVFTDRTEALLPHSTESTIDGKFGDLDYDGDLDLVLAHFPTRPVTVLLNEGNGAFIESTTSVLSEPLIVQALGIEIVDLNQDGLIDIYVCNRGQRDRLLLHTGKKTSGAEGKSEGDLLPGRLELRPNPFVDRTSIEYVLPRPATVDVSIYSSIGERITTLLSGHQPAGAHRLDWNANDHTPGIYFCMIRSEESTLMQPMIHAGSAP